MIKRIDKINRDKLILRQTMNNHIGESKKIEILELCEYLHIDRRYLRDLVREVNLDMSKDYEGKLIVTDTSEGGYWLDDKRDDPHYAAVYYNGEHNRAMKILTKVTAAKVKAEAIHGKANFAMALEIVKRGDKPEPQEKLF